MFNINKNSKKTTHSKEWNFKANKALASANVAGARKYIDEYWSKLTRFNPKDDDSLLGLSYPYLVPAYEAGHEYDFNELYYWDSYFMVQGLLTEKYKDLTIGILENLLYLFRRFKIIPNASRTYLTGRSQPPFLTSFIYDIYDTYKLDDKWLKESIDIAKEEYKTVWMGVSKPNSRKVYRGLSRYYDINYLNDLAEAESGWDMTPRFNRKALEYLPIDLNCLLYKYEMDFARTARYFSDDKEAKDWESAANHRKTTINSLMWDNYKGIYYDYNYVQEKRGTISSLASYYALWSGLASDLQASKMVKALRRFEHQGGLSTTETMTISQYVPGSMPLQWAYPNGWAPLHFLVVKGLEKYGYHQDAKRIALKWLKTNLLWFEENQVFLEKYNVSQPHKHPVKGLYPSQTGFGWTNSIFEVFCKEYIDK